MCSTKEAFFGCAFICLPHEGSIISLRPTFSFPQVIDLNAVLVKCLCNICKNMDCRLSFSFTCSFEAILRPQVAVVTLY